MDVLIQALLVYVGYAALGFYILKAMREMKGVSNNILMFVRYSYILSLFVIPASIIPLGFSKYLLIIWFSIVSFLSNFFQKRNIAKFDIIVGVVFIVVSVIDSLSNAKLFFFFGVVYVLAYTLFYIFYKDYDKDFKRIIGATSMFSLIGVAVISAFIVFDIQHNYSSFVPILLAVSSLSSGIVILTSYARDIDRINNDITKVLVEKEHLINTFSNRFQNMIQKFESCNSNMELHKDKIDKNNIQNLVKDLYSVISDMGPIIDFIQKITKEFKSKADDVSKDIPNLYDSLTRDFHELLSMKQTVSDINTSIMSLVKIALDSEKSVMGVSKSIKELRNSAKNLTDRLKVFSEISDQSSILSINISIEASKLGGKGLSFSKLSQQAKKFSDIISSNVETTKALIQDLDAKAEFSDYMIKTLVMSFIEIETSLKNIAKSASVILGKFETFSSLAGSITKKIEEVSKMMLIVPEFYMEVSRRLEDISLSYKKLKKYYDELSISSSIISNSLKNILDDIDSTIVYINKMSKI